MQYQQFLLHIALQWPTDLPICHKLMITNMECIFPKALTCKADNTESFSTSSIIRKYSWTICGSKGRSKSVAPSSDINTLYKEFFWHSSNYKFYEMSYLKEQAAAAWTGSAGSLKHFIKPFNTAWRVSPADIWIVPPTSRLFCFFPLDFFFWIEDLLDVVVAASSVQSISLKYSITQHALARRKETGD